MATALVTGGAGFVGTNLCFELKKRGYAVRCLDSNHIERMGLFGENDIEFLYADVLDQEKMRKAAKDCDVIFHLATMCLPYSLFDDAKYTLQVSTEGTYNAFLASAFQNGPPFFVYVSSSEVYGRGQVPSEEAQSYSPTTIYGAAKAAGEQVTIAFGQQHNLPYLIVRPFNCYGPYSREDKYGTIITRMLKALIKGGEVHINGDGNQGRDFNYVSDTVDGIIAAYENREKLKLVPTVNICSGQEISLNQLWQLCKDAMYSLCQKSKPIRWVDLKDSPKLVYGPPRPGDIMHMQGSPWYCKNMVGWQPKISLEKGLMLYGEWLGSEERDVETF